MTSGRKSLTAALSDVGSKRSHRTGITPAARSPSIFSGVRVMAATICPSVNMSGIRRTPMTPVAPARKILITLPRIVPWLQLPLRRDVGEVEIFADRGAFEPRRARGGRIGKASAPIRSPSLDSASVRGMRMMRNRAHDHFAFWRRKFPDGPIFDQNRLGDRGWIEACGGPAAAHGLRPDQHLGIFALDFGAGDRRDRVEEGSKHDQSPETSLRPITPASMRAMQNSLSGAAESPSTAIPRIAVPAAPIPVQTA